ncbi:phage major capsid protein [Microbaculum marinum]|uniref:Phage major capsid protein n=1 Tax=Microbaculum marinum TaxID=1764581 RepID=A0AAW9RS99_9HYPH
MEHETVMAALTDMGTATTERFNSLDDKIEALETANLDIEKKLTADRPWGGGSVRSWGDQVSRSEDWAAMAAARRGTIKMAITTADDSGGSLIPPDHRTDPVLMPRRRMRVRDLLNPGQTSSNAVTYSRQTTRTNNAAVVSETTEKPESVYEFETVTAPVRTIAHWVPASVQVYDDAPALASVINGELRYGLEYAEEEELLFGDGTGEHLEGLATVATAFSAPFSASGDTEVDVILQAISQLSNSEVEASGIILNSQDFLRISGLKDAEGRYLLGNPHNAGQPRMWGLPVVATPAMPVDAFLVGAFRRAATVYDKMLPEVVVSSEDRDNFIKNMLTVRAEERLAMSVSLPGALIYGDFGNVSE